MDNIELEIRKRICNEALKHLGKPAKKFNRDFDCFDCEQLVQVVYRDVLGIELKENGYGASTTTRQFTSTIGILHIIDKCNDIEKMNIVKNNILPGDVLFFHTQSLNEFEPTLINRYPGHVAIYLGNLDYIHAKVKKGIVEIDNFEKSLKMQDKLVAYKNNITDDVIKIYQIKYRK